MLDISGDLRAKRLDVGELLFGSEITKKPDFHFFAVNFAVEIEQVQFQQALGFPGGDGRPESEIGDAAIKPAAQARLGDIDSVRGKLFAVRAQVCRGKSELPPELRPANNRAENCVLPAKHLGRLYEITLFDGSPDRRAADHLAIHFHRFNPDDIEAGGTAELFQERQVPGAAFPKRPFGSDTDFSKRLRVF